MLAAFDCGAHGRQATARRRRLAPAATPHGFPEGSLYYDDVPHLSVNWTDPGTLQSAIFDGPVKLGVAADQIETAWRTTGGQSGWFGTGFHADPNEDHCVALCGYGSIAWLAQQFQVRVPAGVDGTRPGYALFTWNSIGISTRRPCSPSRTRLGCGSPPR